MYLLIMAPVLPGTSQRCPARHSRRPCTRSSSIPPWHRTQATLAQTLTRESAWLLYNQVSTCSCLPAVFKMNITKKPEIVQ